MKHLLTICLATLILASCGRSSIKIDANIKGLGIQSVHVAYCGDYGAVDEIVMAQDGKFEVECQSSEITLVTITDFRSTPLALFAAQNGDHIKIEGELSKPDNIKVTGNDATEQWMEFKHKHAALYNAASKKALNQEIEKWVKAHPDKVSSTLLLLFDHSALMNEKGDMPLLNIIKPEARPERLLAAATWLNEYYSHHTSKEILSLNLCSTNGDFEQLSVQGKPTLLYFWSNDRENRTDIITTIKDKMLRNDVITIADVLVDADTARWAATCRADSASWRHYWVPGGVTDIALLSLRIPTVPFFVATDSTGHIVYRGTSVANAIKALP